MLNIKAANNKYGKKDQEKASKADFFIGIGCEGSSTKRYQESLPKEKVNRMFYSNGEEIVFVSINGKRANRIGIKAIEVLLYAALQADCTFIADYKEDRTRDYNIGERELESWFKSQAMTEIEPGVWKRIWIKN